MQHQHYQGQAAAVAAEPRYGQWRRPRSAGLLGLGTAPTIGLLSWVIVSFAAMMIHLAAGWGLLAVGLIVLIPLAVRVGDRTVYQVVLARLAYRRGRWRRQHLLLNGPSGPVAGGTHRLPGVLAASEVYDAQDALARPFGLIHQQGTGRYTAVLRCDADGDQLVDREDVDAWVAGWAHWLGKLPQVPGFEAATVTVETAPD